MEYMYLDNMNGADIRRIRDRDRDVLVKRALHFHDDIHKMVLRRRKYPYADVMYYRIPNSTREYLIVLMYLDKRNASFSPMIMYLPIVREKGGICVYETIRGVTLVNKYIPHVFDRFVERMSDEIEGIEALNRIEVIRLFFKRNIIRPLTATKKQRKGNDEFEVYINDGCLMIHPNNGHNVRIVKTFISQKMLKDGQKNSREKHRLPDKAQIMLYEYLADRNFLL